MAFSNPATQLSQSEAGENRLALFMPMSHFYTPWKRVDMNDVRNNINLPNSEAYSEPCQIFNTEAFAKIFNGFLHFKSLTVFWICLWKSLQTLRQAQWWHYPFGNSMFKVNNRNIRARCEICSKLTIKTRERSHC